MTGIPFSEERDTPLGVALDNPAKSQRRESERTRRFVHQKRCQSKQKQNSRTVAPGHLAPQIRNSVAACAMFV